MTEILTESFCERCGTRYTFESARPRARLKGVKVFSRGLKNFVLSDDTSIDEAMASARSEADRESTAHQLDAFHKTFNFCMSCRQYTCPNCWNEAEVRCLSCAPLALLELAPALDDLRDLRQALLVGGLAPENGTDGLEHDGHRTFAEIQGDATSLEAPAGAAPVDVERADVPDVAVEMPAVVAAETPFEPAAELAAEASETEAPIETIAALEAQPSASPVDVEPVAAEDDGIADVPGDAAGKAAAQTVGLLRRFRPGQSLDAELEAYEQEQRDAAAITDAPEATPTVAAEAIEAEREPEVTPEAPEPAPIEAGALEPAVVSAPEPEPEPEAEPAVVSMPEPEPEAEPAPLAAAAAAAADVVEQPTWRITAPDPTPTLPPHDRDGSVPLQAGQASTRPASREPQWPAQPEWPSATQTAGLPFLGRPSMGQGGIEALWAASNQELVTAPPVPGKAGSGIQPCISCGLSLSATARFCRRCGTLQGR